MILPPEVIETNIINVPFPIDGHERIASFFLGNKAEVGPFGSKFVITDRLELRPHEQTIHGDLECTSRGSSRLLS